MRVAGYDRYFPRFTVAVVFIVFRKKKPTGFYIVEYFDPLTFFVVISSYNKIDVLGPWLLDFEVCQLLCFPSFKCFNNSLQSVQKVNIYVHPIYIVQLAFPFYNHL